MRSWRGTATAHKTGALHKGDLIVFLELEATVIASNLAHECANLHSYLLAGSRIGFEIKLGLHDLDCLVPARRAIAENPLPRFERVASIPGRLIDRLVV